MLPPGSAQRSYSTQDNQSMHAEGQETGELDPVDVTE